MDAYGSLVYGNDVLNVDVGGEASGSESEGTSDSYESNIEDGGASAGEEEQLRVVAHVGGNVHARGPSPHGRPQLEAPVRVSILSASDKQLYEHLDEGAFPANESVVAAAPPAAKSLTAEDQAPHHRPEAPADGLRAPSKPRDKVRRYKF